MTVEARSLFMLDPERNKLEQRFRWHRESSVRFGTRESQNSDTFLRGGLGTSDSGNSSSTFISDLNPIEALAHIFTAVQENRTFGLVPVDRTTGRRRPNSAESATMAREMGKGGLFFCMSSGSSGSPRWICRTHASWLRSFAINRSLWNISPDSECAVLGRLGYSLSLYGSLEALHHGADLLLLGGLRPDAQFAALVDSDASHIYATPTQLRLLAEARRRFEGKEVKSVSRVLVGGAKLDASTSEISHGIFPNAETLEFYGAAETSFIAIANKDSPSGSAGAPYPGTEIEIRDEKDNLVSFGARGEIWVRSPYLFQGYAGRGTEATRLDEKGFLTIGEVGSLDRLGHLYVAGRKNRMVTIADQNVYPELIENFLLGLDGVERAAALPVADLSRGCKIVAFVFRSDGTSNKDDLRKRCRVEFGPLAAPRKIVDLTEWPLLPSGKTDFPLLARLASDERF